MLGIISGSNSQFSGPTGMPICSKEITGSCPYFEALNGSNVSTIPVSKAGSTHLSVLQWHLECLHEDTSLELLPRL